MTAIAQPRRPAGTPTGGQFAESVREESHVALATDGDDLFLSEVDNTPLEESGQRGRWSVLNASTEEDRSTPGRVRMRTHLAGIPHVKVRALSASAAYSDAEGGREDLHSRLSALHGRPATALMVGRNGDVEAVECKPVPYDGGTLLLFKGSSTKGLDAARCGVLDVVPGYGQQQALADTFRRRMAQFTPAVEKVALDDRMDYLPDGDDESTWDVENPAIQAAFMVTGPDLGNGPQPGCVFLATDIQRGSNPGERSIVNGYFWAPTDTGLYSEHGSMYVDDIARGGGRITGYEPGSLTSRQCWQELPEDRGEGYRRILGLSSIKEA